MLLICRDEQAWDRLSPVERQQIYTEMLTLADDLRTSGQFVTGSPLQPSATATSVRVRNGKRLVTDGPFAETREQLGGYLIIDVAGLDEAIAIAERIPVTRVGAVEIRPVREGPPPR